MNLYKKMNWKTIFFLGKWGYLLHFTRNLSERIKEVIIKLGFEVIKAVKQQKKKTKSIEGRFPEVLQNDEIKKNWKNWKQKKKILIEKIWFIKQINVHLIKLGYYLELLTSDIILNYLKEPKESN